MKKLLAIAIILLFIEMSVIPSAPSERISTRDIITVDDEGDGDYTSIKEAVNYANPGDTIEVYSGTYYEHSIVIDKEEITLKGIPYEFGEGNDTGKPVISNESSSYILSIKADGTIVNGFKIKNILIYGNSLIKCSADDCSITDNNLSDSYNAIIVQGNGYVIANNTIINCHNCIYIQGENSVISKNYIRTTSGRGITLGDWCNHITICNNVINTGQWAIWLYYCEKCVFIGNKITSGWEKGIHFEHSNFNTVYMNEFTNSDEGVCLDFSTKNLFIRNNFINNSEHSPFFGGYFFNRNRWVNNYWDDWSGTGFYRIEGRLVLFWIFLLMDVMPIVVPWVNFDWFPAREPFDITTNVVCDIG